MASPRRVRVVLMVVLGVVLGLALVAIALRWARGVGISWMGLGIVAIGAGVFGPRIRRWTGGGEGEEVVRPWLTVAQILMGIGFLLAGGAQLLDLPATSVFVIQMIFFGLALLAVLAALIRWVSRDREA